MRPRSPLLLLLAGSALLPLSGMADESVSEEQALRTARAPSTVADGDDDPAAQADAATVTQGHGAPTTGASPHQRPDR